MYGQQNLYMVLFGYILCLSNICLTSQVLSSGPFSTLRVARVAKKWLWLWLVGLSQSKNILEKSCSATKRVKSLVRATFL